MGKNWVSLAVGLMILGSLTHAPLSAGSPPIKRPMDLFEATIEGGSPLTVDYSIAYDTASSELIQNMMDTLVIFNGEHTDQFLPAVATGWSAISLGPGGIGIDSGNPISGLSFGHPANQTGENATYYYKYDFKIRSGVLFQPPYNYSLMPEDVAYSFQRTIVMDTSGGPQWMLQEPLLDNAASDNVKVGGIADLTNMTEIAELGALIRDSVQYNLTDVWFNLMYPCAYAPFMRILCMTWSSIESKQWINNQVIGSGRPDWNGDWSNLTAWLTCHNPPVSPLDSPGPMMYGSGPFTITTLDYTNMYWTGTRNVGYWRGWPADYPAMMTATPKGYVNTIKVSWAYPFATGESMFLNGDVDFCAVPGQNLADLYQNSSSPFAPPNYPKDGIRCIQPLPTLSVDAYFFNFNINLTNPYGQIGAANTFNSSLIPSDFFGNPTWGVNVRKGFARAFDYNTFLSTMYLGEAIHPATAIIPGLPYYDPTVTGYSYNLAAANESFNSVGPDSNGKMLKDIGFTLTLVSNIGSRSPIAQNLLKSAIESLNPLYHVNISYVGWSDYLRAIFAQKLPIFTLGWLADFPDPHDLAFAFYNSKGSFVSWQGYSNPSMDDLIDVGIATPDGPARAAIYRQIQLLAISDCPDFTLDQGLARHFERDWVVGWYYNPAYSGLYFYNLWKCYYVPKSLQGTSTQPTSSMLPADCNYDGKVDIKDIDMVVKSFGTSYGPPVCPRWDFRCDVNNDRTVNMKDIALVARNFGQHSP